MATCGVGLAMESAALAAHSAKLHNADLEREPAAGKPYRAALVAVAHTLLARCSVMLKEGRPSQPR